MRHFPVTLVLSLVLLGHASAHAADTASLAGSATMEDGTPLPQVILVLQGPSGPRTVVTGPEGRFRLDRLAPGEYTLAPQAPGLVLAHEARVVVADGEAHVDVVLGPAPVRERVVVAATRGDAPLSSLGVSTSALERDEIAQRESSDFVHLLQSVPGVAVTRAGGVGLQSSAFLRGGASNSARVLVDGIPVNEPGGAFDFGAELPLELDRIEVVRGAASSLYGTDALAGVIQLVTRRADPGEAVSLRAEAEGGSFAWRRFQGGTSGRAHGLDWAAGIVRLETDNQEPNSAFEETAGAASLGGRLGDRSALRLVFRGETSSVGTPGQTAFGRPDLDASFDKTGLVLGSQWRYTGDRAAHEVRVGFARSNQVSRDPLDSGTYVPRSGDQLGAFPVSDFTDPEGFQNDTRRLSAGYQAELQAGGGQLITAGTELEHETGAVGSRSGDLLSPQRTNVGAYLQDRIVLGGSVFLTLGGRVEHNDSFGTRAVPRAAVAWRVHEGASPTTLRASAGAGIKEPDFFQSFGTSFFAMGNPDLKPERSRTFDAGIEQRLLGDRLRAEATFYHHEYLDQIAFTTLDFTTFQGTYVNLGKTRARGLELALEAAPDRRIRLGAQYTYLDGKILVSTSDFNPILAPGQALLRRPRHQGYLTASGGDDRFDVGASLVLVGKRADSDFLGIGLTESPAYARLDARAHVRVGHGLEVFVTGENILDRQYQEVPGYPALGRSVRAGLRFKGSYR